MHWTLLLVPWKLYWSEWYVFPFSAVARYFISRVKVITWLCSVVYMQVAPFQYEPILMFYTNRYATNIPDPLLGPKGIRLMLVLRGFCGYVGYARRSLVCLANMFCVQIFRAVWNILLFTISDSRRCYCPNLPSTYPHNLYWRIFSRRGVFLEASCRGVYGSSFSYVFPWRLTAFSSLQLIWCRFDSTSSVSLRSEARQLCAWRDKYPAC